MLEFELEELIDLARKRSEDYQFIPDEWYKAVGDRLESLSKINKILVSNNYINSIKIQAYKEIAELFKNGICRNTYPDFDKNGKPVIIFKVKTGYELIDDILNEEIKKLG